MLGGRRRGPRAVKNQECRSQHEPCEIEYEFHAWLRGDRAYTTQLSKSNFFLVNFFREGLLLLVPGHTGYVVKWPMRRVWGCFVTPPGDSGHRLSSRAEIGLEE